MCDFWPNCYVLYFGSPNDHVNIPISMIVILSYMCLLGIERVEIYIYIFMKSSWSSSAFPLGPGSYTWCIKWYYREIGRNSLLLDHLITSDHFFCFAWAPDMVTPWTMPSLSSAFLSKSQFQTCHSLIMTLTLPKDFLKNPYCQTFWLFTDHEATSPLSIS